MQILLSLLRVIFMLSTIVAVTDCCSSRILLVREHTLKIVRQQKLPNHAQQQQQLQMLEKIPQYLDIPTELDFNKNYSSEVLHIFSPEESSSKETTDEDLAVPADLLTTATADVIIDETTNTNDATATASIDTTDSTSDPANVDATLLPPIGSSSTSTAIPPAPPPVRELSAGSRKYHVIDFYYTLMRDVLSLECSGQYLTDFCLNGGRCFRFPVGNHSFFSCECADGYVGERCESKSLNGLYVPMPGLGTDRPAKILTARIIFTFPMLIAISAIYLLFGAVIVCKSPRHRKQERAAAAAAMFAG